MCETERGVGEGGKMRACVCLVEVRFLHSTKYSNRCLVTNVDHTRNILKGKTMPFVVSITIPKVHRFQILYYKLPVLVVCRLMWLFRYLD